MLPKILSSIYRLFLSLEPISSKELMVFRSFDWNHQKNFVAIKKIYWYESKYVQLSKQFFFSLTRRPIYPGRRSGRYKSTLHFQRQQLASDEGNTSEYSVSPSSKSSTLESINARRPSSGSLKRTTDGSDSTSDSESEENITVVTQVHCAN